MPKPKLLLDENISIQVAIQLRTEEYDVKSVLEETPGIADADVLSQAVQEKRIVVTLDKDFGMLVFRNAHSPVGVIFLRLKKESVQAMVTILLHVLTSYESDLDSHFVTASMESVRLRK